MFNRTAFIHELVEHRAKYHQGVHQTLSSGANHLIYPLAITLSFFVFYHLVNKLVYRLTNTKFIMDLCIQKHINKLENKKKKTSKVELNLENGKVYDRVVLLEEDEEEIAPPENTIIEENLRDSPEVIYLLWFYRFSIMECIHDLLTFPLLIRVFVNFDKIHDDNYVYLSWDTYIIQCMMLGHYLKDFDELFSNGYGKRSRDLIIHHAIAILVFTAHTTTLMNFRWISLILFCEINSFFNRSNLVLKYHDPQQTSLIWNLNCILNILTMIFVRFAILFRYFIYDFYHNWTYITVALWYSIIIFIIAVAMTYLGWTSFRYILLTDVPKLKVFLKKSAIFGGIFNR